MIIICILFLLSFFSNTTFSSTNTSFISLQINPLHVTIWSSWNIFLPELSPSFDTWEIQATFSSNSFWIDDRKTSNSWFITTIQSSDLIYSNGEEKSSIPRENVRFKTSITPSVIYGSINPRVDFGSSIKNIRWNIWKPVVYFKRNAWDNLWIIWRYWDTPSIKVIIPPAQSPGIYTWTIYFTLISW